MKRSDFTVQAPLENEEWALSLSFVAFLRKPSSFVEPVLSHQYGADRGRGRECGSLEAGDEVVLREELR